MLSIQNALKFISQYTLKHSNLCADTRNIQQGDIFCAYIIKQGICNFSYIEEAINQGICAIIADSELKSLPQINVSKIPILYINDLYTKLGEIASEYYGSPSHNIPVIGVTGTNGKTTITQWLAQCLYHLNKKTCVIGTLGSGFLPNLEPSGFTTPDAVNLQRQLSQYSRKGADIISMEVSSHGLEQYRVAGVKFHSAIFTNLSQDHLDYHGNMQAYKQAKQKLFITPNLAYAIINIDDEIGQEFIKTSSAKTNIAYGIKVCPNNYSQNYIWCKKYNLTKQTKDNINLQGYNLELEIKYQEKIVQENIFIPILGEFNIYNLLAVIGSLLSLNYSWQQIKQVLHCIKSVCGRLEIIQQKPLVIVDYAHTPDALEKTLQTLLDIKQPLSNLICVFGCGGNRDATKRYLMGNIAYKLANTMIVTSDNPRFENPQKIIDDIISDISTLSIEKQLIIELDREKAIELAINRLKPDDILLIAGKGHEMYQEINRIKYEFSDQEKAKFYLAKLG